MNMEAPITTETTSSSSYSTLQIDEPDSGSNKTKRKQLGAGIFSSSLSNLQSKNFADQEASQRFE